MNKEEKLKLIDVFIKSLDIRMKAAVEKNVEVEISTEPIFIDRMNEPVGDIIKIRILQ